MFVISLTLSFLQVNLFSNTVLEHSELREWSLSFVSSINKARAENSYREHLSLWRTWQVRRLFGQPIDFNEHHVILNFPSVGAAGELNNCWHVTSQITVDHWGSQQLDTIIFLLDGSFEIIESINVSDRKNDAMFFGIHSRGSVLRYHMAVHEILTATQYIAVGTTMYLHIVSMHLAPDCWIYKVSLISKLYISGN